MLGTNAERITRPNSRDASVNNAIDSDSMALVKVDNLVVHFHLGVGLLNAKKVIHAVDGVSLELESGQTLGLVGESGCGKSTLGRALVGLQRATAGRIYFRGVDVAQVKSKALRELHKHIQMVFQDPVASLNPRMTVEDIIGEPLRNYRVASGLERRSLVSKALEACGLSRDMMHRFPHEFSGGQRQRVGIARALVLRPAFVVCDEPVSALDVSVQAQILNLLEDLQDQLGLTYLFISHDLAVVRHVAHRVAVMYLGKLVEVAACEELYARPLHPYTKAMLVSSPGLERDERSNERALLKGDIPSPVNPPSGCRFHTRCPIAQFPKCQMEEPPLLRNGTDHWVACHFPGKA